MSEREWKQKYAELYRMTTRYIKHLHKAEKDRDSLRARVEVLEKALKSMIEEFEGLGELSPRPEWAQHDESRMRRHAVIERARAALGATKETT